MAAHKINRRNALKALGITAAGAALAPELGHAAAIQAVSIKLFTQKWFVLVDQAVLKENGRGYYADFALTSNQKNGVVSYSNQGIFRVPNGSQYTTSPGNTVFFNDRRYANGAPFNDQMSDPLAIDVVWTRNGVSVILNSNTKRPFVATALSEDCLLFTGPGAGAQIPSAFYILSFYNGQVVQQP